MKIVPRALIAAYHSTVTDITARYLQDEFSQCYCFTASSFNVCSHDSD